MDFSMTSLPSLVEGFMEGLVWCMKKPMQLMIMTALRCGFNAYIHIDIQQP